MLGEIKLSAPDVVQFSVEVCVDILALEAALRQLPRTQPSLLALPNEFGELAPALLASSPLRLATFLAHVILAYSLPPTMMCEPNSVTMKPQGSEFEIVWAVLLRYKKTKQCLLV